VQIEELSEVKLTGKPELADATRVWGPVPICRLGGLLKVIVCEVWPMVKL